MVKEVRSVILIALIISSLVLIPHDYEENVLQEMKPLNYNVIDSDYYNGTDGLEGRSTSQMLLIR